jgi:hypothetical protein
MLSTGWLPHQPSHAVDDISTSVFDRALVIVIASHILQSGLFLHPERLNIWHACHELRDIIPVFDLWQMQSFVFFVQPIVLICHYGHLLDLTLDIVVLFTLPKLDDGIVLQIHLIATLCITFPSLSNEYTQQSAGTMVYFRP